MDGTSFEFIKFVQAGPVATIMFNRPEVMNALNLRTLEEAIAAFERRSRDTRVLVLRGVGDRAFAAGADVGELAQRTPWSDMTYGPRREFARLLESAPFPTLAALNGLALGGGFELALACHLRVASESAKVGLPELRLGMIPGNGGTARLTRLVGRGAALEAILLSEQIDAQRALALGLVNRVFAQSEFDAKVAELADSLARLPPVATQAVLDSVIHGAELPLDRAIENEHRWFQICLGGPDKKEGIAAFREKRKPNFKTTQD